MKQCVIKALVMTALGVVPIISAPQAMADKAAIYTPWHTNTAIGGYDVVSYFYGKPVKGAADYRARHAGVTWRFSNQINLDKFNENPAQYVPQYGGYCAWAVAMDKLAKGDPEHWSVVDDKLYLNFNARIKQRWEDGKSDFIPAADTAWPTILKQ